MFSLLAALMAIALVSVLALVTLNSLGENFDGGARTNVDSATYLNQSQQIKGAANMYVAEHNGLLPSDVNVLVTEQYLKALPDPNWQFAGDYLINTAISLNQCQKYNELLTGSTNVPACTDPNLPENICCQN